jgi:folate-dependent phosphoribosylglycinamide formyltransferase PurN
MTHKRMLINKEAKYGYSIHKVTKYLDDGEILNKNQRNIFTYNEDELILNQKRLEHQSVFKDLVSFLN